MRKKEEKRMKKMKKKEGILIERIKKNRRR